MPLDQLHRVEVEAPLPSDRVYRDDVRVMQLGRRLRLALEALDRLRGHAQCRGQHLQRDAPVERNLPRLVDDPHSAATNLAQDREVSEPPLRNAVFARRRGRSRAFVVGLWRRRLGW